MEEAKQSFDHMTKEEAIAFFAQLYNGAHHIPGCDVHPFGRGWMVKHDRGELSTYDYNELTTLVFLAHEMCYRASISNHGPKALKIIIWKRKREGGMCERHPTIEAAIETFNKYSERRKELAQ